jgi:hypothetical protein
VSRADNVFGKHTVRRHCRKRRRRSGNRSRRRAGDERQRRRLLLTRNGIGHELVFVAPAAPTGQDPPALFAGFELFDDPAGWTDRPLDG